jgi:hypothetical protein
MLKRNRLSHRHVAFHERSAAIKRRNNGGWRMSNERKADAGQRSEEATSKGTPPVRAASSMRDHMRRSSKVGSWERPQMERFIERSLHEAYAATLQEKVPQRFTDLLDRLKASQGGGDGRAR